MSEQRVRPSRGWYWVAGIIALVACALAAAVAGVAVGSRFGEIEVFDVHSPEQVSLEKEATRSIYAESRRGPFPVPVNCSVDPMDGQPAPRVVAVERGSSEVRVNNTLWVAVAKVTAYEDGRYVISCTAPPWQSGRLALGPAVEPLALVRELGLALLLAFGGLTVAAVLATVTAVRRRSSSRSPGAAPPPPAPASGTPPGPPGR